MNCYYHPDRPTVSQCPDCGKGLCYECAGRNIRPICPDCNKNRGKNDLVSYLRPICGIIILYFLGCIFGSWVGETPSLMGYLFTCIYGGWSIVTRFFSNIFVSLNMHSLFMYYGIRILCAAIIGIFATPIYLVYCIVMVVLHFVKHK